MGTHCSNCAHPIGDHRYCARCGQRTDIARLQWWALIRQVGEQFLEWDLPWQRTLRDLTLRPGPTVAAYLDGHRIRYVGPVKYAFYALLIAVLLGGANDWVNLVDADKPAWLRFILGNLPLYFLLMTPVAVLALRLAFWNSPRNSVEITAFALYMLGQTALVIVVVGFIVYWIPKGPAESPLNLLLVLVALAVPLFYALYAVVGFFRSRLDHALIAALLAMGATLWIAGRTWVLLAH